MQDMNTLEQVERYAAAQGIALTPSDRKRIGEVQAAERERLRTLYGDRKKNLIDAWNDLYPRALAFILGIGETLLTFSQTVLVSLGVPVVLMLLMIVEHQRVVHGIMLFETNSGMAGFAAAALVISNLVLELTIHYVEHKAGFTEKSALAWSLKIWGQNMAYRLGIGDQWHERALSPANRWRKLLGLITFTILALALGGSMRVVIEATPGAWYLALVSIVTESNLSLMLTWTGGLLFALAAVLGAQGLTRYVAMRCVEITAKMSAQRTKEDDPHSLQVERAGAVLALAMVNEKAAKRQATRPFGNTPPTLADPESMRTAMHVGGLTTNGNGNGKH